ncbi:MAG: phospholipase [Rhodoferax sp.]|nr:phospholipase [Rhodoferax sp.]
MAKSPTAVYNPIAHVFVLMLENRSFDHLFGLSGLYGLQPPAASFGFKPGAPDVLTSDPPHEFDDVDKQMAGGAMTGFPQFGGAAAMQGFEAGRNPVLLQLAQTGVLMDNWYSSMPGPTWPNRFFAHAASSGGLDNSPGNLDVAQAMNSPLYSYKFQNGHVFDRLLRQGQTWRIYKGDSFPQVLALQGMVDKRLDRSYFRKFSDFKADMAAGDLAAYTFIEPAYDSLNNYANGNSQHPLGSISAGERLIRDTFNAIFTNDVGKNSLLLVTWDEHGGFFDRSKPPGARPPGDDQSLNHQRAAKPRNFAFDRLGPRVPALLVSPWLPSGLGSKLFPGQVFEHSSIVRSVRETFGLTAPLTQRDASAPSWNSAYLATPRALPALAGRLPAPAAAAPVPPPQAISPSAIASLHLASAVDWDLAAKTGKPPLLADSFQKPLATLHQALADPKSSMPVARQQQVIGDYLAAVDQRERNAQKTLQRAAPTKG